MQTKNTTRRAVLAGIAAAPALAAPAVALTDASADAELLALGRKLEPIIDEWRTERIADHQRSEAFEAAAERAGLPRREIESFADTDEWRAYIDRRWEAARPEDADEGSWDDIHERMYPIVDAILAVRASTIAGLVVQAQTISLSEAELWGAEYDEEDPIRKFIDAVCAFAGVTPLPLTLPENMS